MISSTTNFIFCHCVTLRTLRYRFSVYFKSLRQFRRISRLFVYYTKPSCMCMSVRSNLFILFLFLLSAANGASAQPVDFPVPSHNPKQLFYLQRPANTNTLIYELNMENGIINKEKPIHVYWINYASNGQTEELNDLQRKYAYGVKTTDLGDNTFEFYLVAYKKLKLTLKEGEDKQYHVYTVVNDKNMIVTRIYLAVKGGSLFKPHIEYVELKGTDATTGVAMEEKIKL